MRERLYAQTFFKAFAELSLFELLYDVREVLGVG